MKASGKRTIFAPLFRRLMSQSDDLGCGGLSVHDHWGRLNDGYSNDI